MLGDACSHGEQAYLGPQGMTLEQPRGRPRAYISVTRDVGSQQGSQRKHCCKSDLAVGVEAPWKPLKYPAVVVISERERLNIRTDRDSAEGRRRQRKQRHLPILVDISLQIP